MRKEFIDGGTREDAENACPWAAEIIETVMTDLLNDLRRFFALETADADRVREIAEFAVSPGRRADLIERLNRCAEYGIGSRRGQANKLIARIGGSL